MPESTAIGHSAVLIAVRVCSHGRSMFDDPAFEEELLRALPSQRQTTRGVRRNQAKEMNLLGIKLPKLVLAHEMRVHRGSVPFDTIKAITSDELSSDRKLYKDVAVPVFGGSPVHLRVSLRLLLEAIGARSAGRNARKYVAKARSDLSESSGGRQKGRLSSLRSRGLSSLRLRGSAKGVLKSDVAVLELAGGAQTVQQMLTISKQSRAAGVQPNGAPSDAFDESQAATPDKPRLGMSSSTSGSVKC